MVNAILAWGVIVQSALGAEPGAMRIGLPAVAETLDPARVIDADSMSVVGGIYDTLYRLDPMARPFAIVPAAATTLPEIADDYRTFTIRVRAGIHFTSHPSFGGKPRELTASDFAYSWSRVLDPRVRSPGRSLLEGKIEGLDALATQAKDARRGLDYDKAVTGLTIVDRYTLRIRLTAPDPTFPFLLAHPMLSAVPREVVEAEGDSYGHRPIGSGGYVVVAYTPGARITLARNSGYRALRWEDLLTPDSRSTHAGHPMRGRRLPATERIEIVSTPESGSEVLALRRGELDIALVNLPELAVHDGRARDELVRDGLVLATSEIPGSRMLIMSSRNPVVGGESQAKIALRRAIFMAFDDAEWIRVHDAGLSRVREQLVPPGIAGHVPGYRNPNRFDPRAANALLDRFGYKPGRDGLRRNPDGTALTVSVLMEHRADGRKRAEFLKRTLGAIAIHTSFEFVNVADHIKRVTSCRYGLSWIEWQLDVPDGTNVLLMFSGKAIGTWNMTCHTDAQFDAAFEQALTMPTGSVRTELFRKMQSRLDAYGYARAVPFVERVFLKRNGVVGPFPTFNDYLQLTTLGFAGR